MPTTYRGNACTYKRATLLASLGSHTFDYDANGLRTKKNDTFYTYIGGKLIREESSGRTIDYIYANDGITGIKYNGAVYLFRKNVFGDVTHIYDMNGVLHARYIYDAWGNHTVVNDTETEIGTINPIRYRSYYYDTETKLYYLRARYYDPETGRFISQDNVSYLDPAHLIGLNLYVYCSDNPVTGYDPSGKFVITLSSIIIGALIGAGIGAAVSFGATVVNDYKDDGEIFNGSVSVKAYFGNTLGGAIAGAGIGVCATLGAGFGAALFGKSAALATAAIKTTAVQITLSGNAALAIGATSAFASGALGYVTRTLISDQEMFETADMFIEATGNMVSGLFSFVGGMHGGMAGTKIPGRMPTASDFFQYQIAQVCNGVYIAKIWLSQWKTKLKKLF